MSNGTNLNYGGHGGAGSGGGIFIKTMSGINAGNISAKGGKGGESDRGVGGSGAGGRVVVKATSDTGTPNVSGGPLLRYAGTKGGTGTYDMEPFAYDSSFGLIGGTGSGDIGLQFDAVGKVDWQRLQWDAEPLQAGQKIEFQIRTATTLVGLDNATYVGTDGTSGSWFGENNKNIPNSVADDRFAEIMVRLTSDGTNTPVLNSLSLNYQALKAPSANLAQEKISGEPMGVGAKIANGDVVLKVEGMQALSGSTGLKAQFEVKQIGQAFDETGLIDGSVDQGGVSTATINKGVGGYHWRARLTDNESHASDWGSFGGNLESATDFEVTGVVEPPSKPGVASAFSPTTNTKPTWYWNPSSGGTGGVKGYYVYVGSAPGLSDVVNGEFTPNTFYKHSASLSQDFYYARVVAIDNADNLSLTSFPDGQLEILTDAALKARTPTFLDVAEEAYPSTRVNLSWQESPSGNDDYYKVYRENAPITDENLGSATLISGEVRNTGYTDKSTQAGQTYYYQVTAVNKWGIESKVSIMVINDKAMIADQTSFLWTTKADFETNDSTTNNATTRTSEIDTSSAFGDVRLSLPAQGEVFDVGTGNDGDYTLAQTKTIEEIYEVDLGNGIGSYNPSTGAVPNFNNLTIADGGVLSSSSLIGIEFKVKGTLTIDSGGKIDVNGLGYAGGATAYGTGRSPSGDGPGGGQGGAWWYGNVYAGGGGGHGSYGGDAGGTGSQPGKGGPSYGAYPEHPTFGSGGGGGHELANSDGASGGGSIKIEASSVIINGELLADGNAALNAGGGGSGGGIYILSSNEVISNFYARGGQGGYYRGGSGAGGRVVVQAPSVVGIPEVSGAPANGGLINPGKAGGTGTFTAVTVPTVNGSIGSTGTGLQAMADKKVKWISLAINTEDPASENIKMQIRVADTEVDLSTANYVGSDGTSNTYFNKNNLQIPASIGASKWAEIKLILSTNETLVSPNIHSIKLNYENIAAPEATSLSQHMTNDQVIPIAQVINTAQVKLKVNGIVSATNANAEFEIKKTTEAFSGANLVIGSSAAGGISEATVAGLIPAKAYHWRARVVDSSGAQSKWISYGNNSDGDPPAKRAQADFIVEGDLSLPRNLNVVAAVPPEKAANLTWSAPPVGSVDHYNIYRLEDEITDSNFNQASRISNNTKVASYVDKNVYPGDTYYYQVTAVDSNGNEGALSMFAKNTKAYIQNKAGEDEPDDNPHKGSEYSTSGAYCKNCHTIHEAKGDKKVFRKVGEELCFTCHDGTGSSFNIMVTFKDKAAHDKFWDAPDDTGIKCTKCHHPHGATNYQGKDSGERMTKKVEEKLCLDCHDKPISVNNWNIAEQFGRKSSHAVESTTTKDGLKGAKVECSSCHNPHVAEKGKAYGEEGVSLNDITGRLIDPTNTFKKWDGSLTEFCLKCHQGWNKPEKKATASEFVPYTIEFPDVAQILSPFFPGWDKTDYRQAAHGQKEYQCNQCHQPHGSENDRLNAFNISGGLKTYDLPKPGEETIATYELAAAQDDYSGGSGLGYTESISANKFGISKNWYSYRTFLRFKINLPKDAIIIKAYVENLQMSDGWFDLASRNFYVNIIDQDNVGPFSGQKATYDLPVTNSISWPIDPNPVPTRTPDIYTLVQSFIDRVGYNEDNYFGIRLHGGSDKYDIMSLTNYESGGRPRLKVIYYPTIQERPVQSNEDALAYDLGVKEEQLCFQCHRPGNDQGAPDIYTPFYNRNYTHNKLWDTGKHKDTEDSSNLSDANRHSECQDCHDPHKAKPEKHVLGSNLASGPITGVKGIGVINGAAGSQPLLYPVNQITYEYELCFKCHSNYVTGGSGSNRAKEFNPNNAAYHPIEGLGKNLGIKDQAFVLGTPWNPTAGDDPDYGLTGNVGDPNSKVDPNYANGARVTCTDCHGNSEPGAKGPHGSNVPKILKKSVPNLCFQCHSKAVYWDGTSSGSRFPKHPGRGKHNKVSCTTCHSVHGSATKPHMIEGSGVVTWSHNETGDNSNCTASCHDSSWGGMKYNHSYPHFKP